jgi:hypothetical protein
VTRVLSWLAVAAALGGSAGAATAQTAPPAGGQEACLGRVTQAYNAEKLARVRSGSIEMPSVDQILSVRRSQENHCQKVTQCLADPGDSTEAKLDRAKVFASCLERETVEQYDARRR